MLAGDFFFVEVGGRGAVVDLAEPVECPCREEQGRNQLRLASSTMSDDSDIADSGGVVDLHTGTLLATVRVMGCGS